MSSARISEGLFLRAQHELALSETVTALRRPASYPERVHGVEAIETHMSWVFLTDEHAYKLKKPITLPMLDYSTRQARYDACQQELTLNRRLAASVYLDVVPLVRERGALRVGAAGESVDRFARTDVVDWLVKMRRLPRADMLDARIARGAVKPDEIDELARRLMAFYARAEHAGLSATAYCDKLEADIADKRAVLLRPRYALERSDVDQVADALQLWAKQQREVLMARAPHVVDAHGDLRLEHVCLEPEPVVIDCLEFDRSLRLLDPLSELCFVALQTRQAGAPWIGERLLQRYRESEGHAHGGLLGFYQRYHALVRAVVAIWHLDDCAIERVAGFRARAEDYLKLAQQLP